MAICHPKEDRFLVIKILIINYLKGFFLSKNEHFDARNGLVHRQWTVKSTRKRLRYLPLPMLFSGKSACILPIAFFALLIDSATHLMKKFLFLLTVVCFFTNPAAAEVITLTERIASDSSGSGGDACNNPILLTSATVLNTPCGTGTGGIILEVQGGNFNYQFNWSPNVSSGNLAFNLSAGTYAIHIVRNSQPDCTLDTTIIVNNSNGPEVDISDVKPATCLLANGQATLSPSSLQYAWSNGATGATVNNLAGGCYYVTATEPTMGCFAILRVCIPRVNNLQTDYTILKQAKCGRPTGIVQLTVTGGSGNYTYSLGSGGPYLTGLLPGSYTNIIKDNASVCVDTVSFVVPNLNVSGSIGLTIYDVKCPGGKDGYVDFQVTAGENFLLPYTFALRDSSGNETLPVFPGNLAAGPYSLYITDADSCTLPTSTFIIDEPPPFSVEKSTAPQTCTEGGQILLTLSGSNSGFTVDWADLPGTDDGKDRLNLAAGRYSATVYDRLFCQYSLDTVLIAQECAASNTLYRIVAANTADTFCLDLPIGVAAAEANFALVDGGISGSSAFGNWILKPNGCLIYTAKATTGHALDTICIAETINIAGLSQMFCIIVSITATVPTEQIIYFSVLAQQGATACGNVPPGIALPTINLLNINGLNGTSGSYGSYAINPTNACIAFQAFGQPGYNVDDIGVAVCGGSPFHCTVIHYVPTVLPPASCIGAIQLPPSLTLTTNDCAAGATTCLPAPFPEINNYAIFDNGLPYQGGFQPCDYDTLTAYPLGQIPTNGPFTLTEWLVNGQPLSGSFSDVTGLLALLNVLDVAGNWRTYNNAYLVGGQAGNTYGTMKITAASGAMKILVPGIQYVPTGTELHLAVGAHTVVFRSVLSGCADTVAVQVSCMGCPSLHSYVPDASNNIRWMVSNCDFDTTFCTDLPGSQVGDFEIKDHGQLFTGITFCGSQIGLTLDTGYHRLTVRQLQGSCEYLVHVYVTCPGVQADTLLAVADQAVTTRIAPVPIQILANDIYRGPLQVELLGTAAFGTFSYEPILGVLSYTPDPDSCGVVAVSYQITDQLGRQSTAAVSVTVACDKVIVFNGLSPNGDNLNDVWHLVGIEQFPKNEVQVFNRWGNRVLLQKGYSNQSPWAGQWNGKELPDGTYFYVIDLGDGSDPLSGYLQLLR